jgi:hypothetical protein
VEYDGRTGPDFVAMLPGERKTRRGNGKHGIDVLVRVLAFQESDHLRLDLATRETHRVQRFEIELDRVRARRIQRPAKAGTAARMKSVSALRGEAGPRPTMPVG